MPSLNSTPWLRQKYSHFFRRTRENWYLLLAPDTCNVWYYCVNFIPCKKSPGWNTSTREMELYHFYRDPRDFGLNIWSGFNSELRKSLCFIFDLQLQVSKVITSFIFSIFYDQIKMLPPNKGRYLAQYSNFKLAQPSVTTRRRNIPKSVGHKRQAKAFWY